MTDEFQKGLITGLAMQSLQVTTEHSTPDSVTETPSAFIHGYVLENAVSIINMFQAFGDNLES